MRNKRKGSLAARVVEGTGWLYASRYGGKVVNLIATIFLARLLTQDEFGVAGYALVFIGFLEVLEGFGVGSALVYMKEREDSKNMAFWISVVFSLVLAMTTYFLAPLAGVIFNDPRAVPVTQALALIFPLTALRSVHKAILVRQMEFSRIAVPEFTKAGIKAFAAIGFAFFGLGSWSLIFAQIVSTFVETLIYWRINRWRPSGRPSIHTSSLRTLLSYGSGISGVNIIGFLLSNIDFVLIGRYMGAVALGTYMMGFRIPNLLIGQFIRTISQVIFPVFVHMNEQKSSMADGWLTATRYILIFTVPASLGLAAMAEPFVHVILGEKWQGAIGVVAAISIFGFCKSLSFNVGDVYKATGRVNLLFKLNLVRAVVTVPAMWFVTVNYLNITTVAWTHVAISLFMTVIQWVVAGQVLSVSLKSILASVGRPIFAGMVMVIAVMFCNTATETLSNELRLILGVSTGILIYCLMCLLILREDLNHAISVLRQKNNRK